MKPMGRKHYKDKTGGKHHIRIKGKFIAWWEGVCTPSKTKEKQQAKRDIKLET